MGWALRFLGYRARSEAEIQQRLLEWQVDPSIAGRVLTRLRQLPTWWVDDEAFAAWWVESRNRHSPRGRLAIRAELRRKGVAEQAIDGSLSELDEDDAALTLALERAGRLRTLPRPDFERRLGGYLARRGFDGDTIRTALAKAWTSLTEADTTD